MNERSRAPRQVGVFEPSTPSIKSPDWIVDEDEARRRIDNGEARWINHGKGIRLFRSSNEATSHRAGSAECNPIAVAIMRETVREWS